jgi:signal transduction histidine kinase
MTDGLVAARRSALGRLRAWPRRHPMVADTMITLGVVAVIGFRKGGESGSDHEISMVVGLLLGLPLIARRRYPLIVFGFVAAVAAGQWLFGRIEVGDIALLIAVYTVAAYRERLPALIAWGVLEVGVVLAVARWTERGQPMAFVFLSGMATAAFVLGRNARTRRAYLASLEDRARRAEHERDQQAQLAAAAERARIAREMHDIVTHNLSVMIALADGAEFAAARNPDAARNAARQVSATGRQALTEMHRLLGVLRGNGTEPMRAPQPGIDQLDDLATQVRSAGLPTSLTLAGLPFPVSPTAQLAVYRVVQEALTNVLKHAISPTVAKVTVRYEDPVVAVEIDDDGQGRSVRPASANGHGLGGMAERVAMFDGQVEAGPRPEGGWRVRAELAAGSVAG